MANDLLIIQCDARAIPLADSTVQCVVTSPPYWGLRKYSGDQGAEPYGLEPSIDLYIQHTVEILREIRRVLRRDGVVFWNLGDSYAANRANTADKPGRDNMNNTYDPPVLKRAFSVRRDAPRNGNGGTEFRDWKESGCVCSCHDHVPKPKDLCLIPERVALAAQADGWWVRSRIVWAKPNPMPESVTDRPTDAMEHIWMFTRSERYFWDADAVREPSITNDVRRPYTSQGSWEIDGRDESQRHGGEPRSATCAGSSRNLRNVWTFPTQPYKGAHFATFPEEIPRRCILAATSERGACVQCGAPWGRVSSRQTHFESGSGRAGNPPNGKHGREWEQAQSGDYDIRMGPVNESQTIGWRPGCECRGQRGRTRPCIVLDPFGGSGTTARVAVELNRRAVSLDLAYHDHAAKRTREVQRRLPAT